VVKRKRRRKLIQLKRKINIFIRKLNSFHLVFMQLMVILLLILDKGNITQQRKTCPSCGPRNFYGSTLGSLLLGLCHTTIKMDAETVKKNE
jgi:ribosomal protein S27AE